MEIILLIFDLLFSVALFIAWWRGKKIYHDLYEELQTAYSEIKTSHETMVSFKEEISQWKFLIQQKPAKAEKNTIEEKEIEEIDLDDGYRIPLAGGVNIQIEGEKKSRPINIMPLSSK